MLKRTMGRSLLTLLVVTGLAGTVNDFSLSQKERKSAISLMKETKTDMVKSIKGLSHAQLNFRKAPGQWSVKECVYHIAISEKNLWELLEATMKKQANPEKRSEIRMTDEQLIQMMEDRSNTIDKEDAFETKKKPYQSLDEALEAFKSRRANHIKYLKSTTEDMRNHVVHMPFGWLDCYQLCLMIASHSNRHTRQINEIITDPAFPSR